jgi:acyl-CoA synthetase (AMP-forming)/AMP-acid ligase II
MTAPSKAPAGPAGAPSRHLSPYPTGFRPTMPELLARAVAKFGDAQFMISADDHLSFAELEQRSGQLALGLLERGAGKGTRVALYAHNGIEWAIAFTAITRIGAVAMPLSTFCAPPELAALLRSSDAAMLLAGPVLDLDLAEVLRSALPALREVRSPGRLFLTDVPYLRAVLTVGAEVTEPVPWISPADRPATEWPLTTAEAQTLLRNVEAEVTPADWMVVIHTSGTSAAPKGVVHTHGAQVRHGANLADFEGWAAGEACLAAMPFFWVGGLTYTFMRGLYAGVTLLVQPKFEAGEALSLIERARPKWIMSTPVAIKRLNAHPTRALRSLDDIGFITPLGAPPEDPLTRHGALGMTETCGPHTTASAAERGQILPPDLMGSHGRPLPNVGHKIVSFDDGLPVRDGEVGEICVRGYSVTVGRLKQEREELFDADGWLHTGDRGYFKSGYLFFLGRATTMIKTAGANVAPPEVEAALLAQPGVSEAYVFGVPDAERGELVGAVVVPDEGAELVADQLAEGLRKNIAAYKVPRLMRVWTPDEVPRLSSGKPDRAGIRALALRQLSGLAAPAGNEPEVHVGTGRRIENGIQA